MRFNRRVRRLKQALFKRGLQDSAKLRCPRPSANPSQSQPFCSRGYAIASDKTTTWTPYPLALLPVENSQLCDRTLFAKRDKIVHSIFSSSAIRVFPAGDVPQLAKNPLAVRRRLADLAKR